MTPPLKNKPFDPLVAEFIYSVSHDLSAPLRAVMGFSGLLQMDYADKLDGDAKTYLDLIIAGGEKMQQMLTALVDLSRLSTARISPIKFDGAALIQKCLENLGDKREVAKARIDVSDVSSIYGDMAQIEKLFTALLDNALLYHQANKLRHIQVSGTTSDGATQIKIQDNGIGLDTVNLDKVYLPFKRLHADNEYPGLGMGLAYAKAVVDRHGGAIQIETRAGKGTIVSLSMPLEEPAR